MVMTTLSNETRMFRFTSPTIRCPGGIQISADSATVYESTSYNQLYGNVVFWDQDSRLTADQAQYFSDQRRLVAQGNTVLTELTEGSIIRGDNMVLVRAGPGQPEDFLTVTGRRPHATLYPAIQPAVSEVGPDSINPGEHPLDRVPVGGALPDTLAEDDPELAPDSLTVPPDTTAVPQDSVTVPPALRTAQSIPEPQADRVPYEIDAQRFILEGTRFFRATGAVEVTRDSLTALADSLEYDQDEGFLFLSESARVTTAQTDLAADAIKLDIPQDEVRSALATGQAILDGDDLRLLAPIVTLHFTEGRLEHLVATRDAVADSLMAELDEEGLERERLLRGAPPLAVRELGLTEFPQRPYTLAQDFILEGDSLEVHAPGEILEEVWAMGNARGESAGLDSLNSPDTPPLIARDWLEGDTIVAIFGEVDSLSVEEESPPELNRDVEDEPPLKLNRDVEG